MKPLSIFAFLTFSLASLCWPGAKSKLDKFIQDRKSSGATPPASSETATGPRCEVIGDRDKKITCTYTPTTRSSRESKDEIRIVLNGAVLSFGTIRDSYMLVDLTFTNEGAGFIPGPHTVYLTIDDESGQNMVRRVLPKVDFSKLSPGVPTTFSERFLIGGFRPGHYTISLMIPNSDPSLKNNPERNILLSSEGVTGPMIGSNTIAHFNVGP
jgi:Domain of unknown function (DUF4832)